MVVAFSAHSGFDVSVVLIASNTRAREIPQALNMLYLLGGKLCSPRSGFASKLRPAHTAHLRHSPRQIRQTLLRGLHLSRIHAVITVFNAIRYYIPAPPRQGLAPQSARSAHARARTGLARSSAPVAHYPCSPLSFELYVL